MRRALFVAVLLSLIAIPAGATGADLGDMLEDADAAEFHGEGIVLCTWGEDSAAAIYDVTRSDGMSMAHGPEGTIMVFDGVAATRRGANWYGLEVSDWSSWSLSDRYTVTEPAATTRLGRAASEVVILEEGEPRARLILDDQSTVPLLTEIYGGDGELFRLATLIDFRPGPTPDMPDMPDDYERVATMTPADDAGALPEVAGGYRRVDAYLAPEGAVQGFYSDGLFSFSVFEAKRGATPEEFRTATVFAVQGRTYRRIVTPSHVWVQWHAPDHTYVLVGDLPPDHIERVLTALPGPGNRGVLIRMWRRLFG